LTIGPNPKPRLNFISGILRYLPVAHILCTFLFLSLGGGFLQGGLLWQRILWLNSPPRLNMVRMNHGGPLTAALHGGSPPPCAFDTCDLNFLPKIWSKSMVHSSDPLEDTLKRPITRAVAYFVKRDKAILLPVGAVLRSPLSVLFSVASMKRTRLSRMGETFVLNLYRQHKT
jgi:hypothetical protein